MYPSTIVTINNNQIPMVKKNRSLSFGDSQADLIFSDPCKSAAILTIRALPKTVNPARWAPKAKTRLVIIVNVKIPIQLYQS
jgi:hypothetical protein